MTMLARTLAPVLTAKWLHALSEKMMPTVSTELVLSGMSLQDQVLYAQGALRTMGCASSKGWRCSVGDKPTREKVRAL
jgi:hypothetical protein